MRPRFVAVLVACAGLALAAGTADAMTCYLVYDASDNVIYRDQATPVDLSARGTAERDAMRKRGEYMLIMDTDRCQQIVVVPVTDSGRAPIDEYLSNVKSVLRDRPGIAAPVSPGPSGSAVSGSAPSAPAAAAAPRRSAY